jgi:hypothetical protein
LDVGKYSSNIVAAFQNSNGLISIGGGDCVETRRFNHFQSANSYETFVLNDKHDRSLPGAAQRTTTKAPKKEAFPHNVAQLKMIQGLA